MLSNILPVRSGGSYSYASAIGLAVQSHRFHTSMQLQVQEMILCTSQALLLQEAAVISRSQALADTNEATADEVKVVELNAQAAEFELQAKALEDKAIIDEEESKALEARVIEEQLAAQEAAVKLAADEAFADQQDTLAVNTGAKAAMDEAGEIEDGTAIALCEFVPFLDLVCDGFGAVAAISLHADVAAEVAQAVSAMTEAAAARSEQTKQELVLSEQETASATHANEAAALETKAKSEQAKALQDQKLATKDEAEAKVLQNQANELETLAVAENAEANVQETQSASEMNKAGQHGRQAAQKAMLSTAVGMVALAFFGVKASTRTIGSITILFAPRPLSGDGHPNAQWRFSHLPFIFTRDISYYLMHGWILLGTTISMIHFIQHSLPDASSTYNLRSHGGMIFLFALLASSAHCLLLHLVQDLLQQNCRLVELGKLFVFLIPFIAIEALILLVTLGWTFWRDHAAIILAQIPIWSVGIGCFVLVAFHILVSHHPIDHVDLTRLGKTTLNCEQHVVNESTWLIEKGNEPSHDIVTDTIPEKTNVSYRYAWQDLLIPFEILIATCLFAILVSCFSHTKLLWPLLSDWIGNKKWSFIVILLSYIFIVVMFTSFVACNERKNTTCLR